MNSTLNPHFLNPSSSNLGNSDTFKPYVGQNTHDSQNLNHNQLNKTTPKKKNKYSLFVEPEQPSQLQSPNPENQNYLEKGSLPTNNMVGMTSLDYEIEIPILRLYYPI